MKSFANLLLSVIVAFSFAGCATKTLPYRLARYGICGTVRDSESMEPVSNAVVVAYYYGWVPKGECNNPELRFAQTDANGNFCIPDEYEKVRRPYSQETIIEKLFRSFSRIDFMDVTAYSPLYFSGIFILAEGYPVSDCTQVAHARPWPEGVTGLDALTAGDKNLIYEILKCIDDANGKQGPCNCFFRRCLFNNQCDEPMQEFLISKIKIPY